MQMCDVNAWIFLMPLNIWNNRKGIILFAMGFLSHVSRFGLYLNLKTVLEKTFSKHE